MTSDGEKAPVGRVHRLGPTSRREFWTFMPPVLGPGVAPRDIQYEVFGPDLWQADLD
jgi:nitric oxide dioxygenase